MDTAHTRPETQAENDRRTWKELAARWLFGQDVSTVLLIGILASLWYMGYYAMNTAIPAHLQSIQAGYERMERAHTDNITRIEASHAVSITYIMESLRETRRQP